MPNAACVEYSVDDTPEVCLKVPPGFHIDTNVINNGNALPNTTASSDRNNSYRDQIHCAVPKTTTHTLSYKIHSEPQLSRFDVVLSSESGIRLGGTHENCHSKRSMFLKGSDPMHEGKTVLNVQTSPSSERNLHQTIEEVCDGQLNYSVPNKAFVLPNDSFSAPNGGWGWLVVAGSFLCLLTVDGVCFSYGLLMHQAITDGQFHSQVGNQNETAHDCPSLAAFSLPGGLFCGITLLCGPLVGALTNRFDFRPVAMCGALMISLACLLCGLLVKNIVWFTVVFGLLGGFGCSLVYLPAITVVGYWFDRHRALVVGLTLCGSGLGSVLLAALLQHLSTASTFHGTLVVIACLFLQILVGIALFRPLHVHELILLKQAAHRRQLSSKPTESKNSKTSRLTVFLRRCIKPSIPRGSIMARIIEEKSRQRTTSTGSLDGMVITRNNELVALPAEACEIAMAAASFYAGNQLLSEWKASLAEATANCSGVSCSQFTTTAASTRSQNLEPLPENITLSRRPLSLMTDVNDPEEATVGTKVSSTTAATAAGFPSLTAGKRSRAAVRRIALDLVRKLEADYDSEAPQRCRSASYVLAPHLPEYQKQQKAQFPGGFWGINQLTEVAQPLLPSALLHNQGEAEMALEPDRQSPGRAVSLVRESRLTSLASLDSRTSRAIARQLSLLPLDRADRAAVLVALRVELSRPNRRLDLFYPGRLVPGGRQQASARSLHAGHRCLTLGAEPSDGPSAEAYTQPVVLEVPQVPSDKFPPDEALIQQQSHWQKRSSNPGFQGRILRSQSYSHRTTSCRFRSIPSAELQFTAPVIRPEPTASTVAEDGSGNEFVAYLRDMLDTRLLRKPAFLLMLMACSLNISVLLVPFHYLPLLLDFGGLECRYNIHWCPRGLPHTALAGDGYQNRNQTSLYVWITDEFAFANRVATLVVIGLASIAGRLTAAAYIQRGLSQVSANCGQGKSYRRLAADPMFWNNSALLLCALSLAGIPVTIHGLAILPGPGGGHRPSSAEGSAGQQPVQRQQLWSMETRICLFFFSALAYGFANAVSLSLRSVIVVELFGIRHLTNAFGYLLITQGLATTLGPPLFGYFCDSACHSLLRHYNHLGEEQLSGTDCTNQLIYTFYACSAVSLLSACLFAPLRWLNKLTKGSSDHQYRKHPSIFEMSDAGPTPHWFARVFTSDSTLGPGCMEAYDHQETQTTHIIPDRVAHDYPLHMNSSPRRRAPYSSLWSSPENGHLYRNPSRKSWPSG